MRFVFSKLVLGLLILSTAIGFSGCKKDIGNYDYNTINELVAIPNLPKVLEATYGKQLSFKPEVVFSKDGTFDETKYTYEWIYTGPNGLGGSKLFTLSQTKDLDMVLSSVVAGSYAAYFGITDKETGVKYKQSFTFKVVNEFNEGWMLLNEANGKARLDMLSLNKEGGFDLVIDLLATTASGLVLEGKPVFTYTYSTGLLIGPDQISYGFYLGTDKTTTKIDANTFKWTPTMALSYEMFGEIPNGFYANAIQSLGGSAAYMIGHGNAYHYSRVNNVFFSAPISYISDEQRSFEVAPFIGGNSGVFYDKTNKRFVKHQGIMPTCSVIPDPAKDQLLFSFKTGMDLAYMTKVSYNGGEIFSILKDAHANKAYLARFNASNNVQTYYAEILGAEIDKADFYAINPEFGYLFYAVGGKVYEYDMVYKTAKLMLDFGSKKISYLNFYEFLSPGKYKDGNKLMIGFYDPNQNTGNEGSLAIYTVPGLNAALVLDKQFDGFGRVKSITYRER